MITGLNSLKGMLSMARSAKPEPFMPRPKANPPATIQMTLQLISCKSLPVMTPVMAKIPIGTMATVLESMPVILPGMSQRRMVRMNVPLTTHMRHPLCMCPLISNSMVFCVKGKNFKMMRHEMNIRTMTSGNMSIIQLPKLIPMFNPSGLLRA